MTYLDKVKHYQKNLYVRASAVVLVALIITLGIREANNNESDVVVTPLPSVKVASAATLSGGNSLSLIGAVRAFTEAQITSERSGRVTSVSAELGGRVSAGQVIATLENASERAAVLQAQGAYEAALAASAQSTVGVSEASNATAAAKNNLVSALRGGYNTSNSVVTGNIDQFFSNPNSYVPGLKINSSGRASDFNALRVEFQDILSTWSSRTSNLTVSSDLSAEAAFAKSNLNKTILFCDMFIAAFAKHDGSSAYTDEQLKGYVQNFSTLKSNLLQSLAAIESTETQVRNAKDAETRAGVAAGGGEVSASGAQIKQALGSLRAAQANLAKTILRSPISGTVNSLNIKLGDFVNGFDTVSVIANNNALEIVTYVGDLEKDLIVVGEKVSIEGKYEGIITNIAPAVDPQTKKTEVRIATDNTDIANGDTVRITRDTATSSATVDAKISVPITAVKFEAENGNIFIVENEVLVARPVKIGIIRGSYVEITEGLSATDEFVVDARGLSAGTKVEVTR